MYIYISTTRACAPVQRCSSFLAMEAIANLSWVLREHRAGCRFRPPSCPFVEPAALLLARWPTCSLRNPSKSTLAHDAVAAVVLHEHHLIIRVSAGLIQFVYGSHSRMVADPTLDKNLFLLPFSRVVYTYVYRETKLQPETSSWVVGGLNLTGCYYTIENRGLHRKELDVFVEIRVIFEYASSSHFGKSGVTQWICVRFAW